MSIDIFTLYAIIEVTTGVFVKYFRNTDLAKLYNVSEKSVRNWILAAQEGKLDLQLYEEKNKCWVANTSRNTGVIEQLVEKGRKYKNSRGHKSVSPTSKFYHLYSKKQILDIISNLTIHHEIPLQYSYSDGGAEYWDKYSHRLITENTSNVLEKTIELIDLNLESLKHLIKGKRKINIVDLGPGNGLPVKLLLSRLVEFEMLGRYIAIDSSKEMLAILESNIKTWFGDSVPYEGHIRDFSNERFDDLLADEYSGDDADVPINLALILGGTLSNFRSPAKVLQTINSSLGLDDLLIYTGYLDTPHSRRYFDFDVSGLNQKLSTQEKLILDLLGIEESLYDVDQRYDEEKGERSISILPKVDLSVKFDLAKGTRHIHLQKNVSILLWRHRHYSSLGIIEEFDRNSFDLMQAATSDDQEYLMLIARIKTSF